ncbi:MAG: efflux RND transporter permease subunit [Hyphomonadaceae bacterium]|nr:efflux RND transporter permease subunit [Hyphomonadaceae bacterium]
MNGIVAWFARNAIAANLLMAVAFIGGIFAYFSLEREIFPVVPVAGASVSVAWSGASPAETEEQLVVRIEEAIADLDGIDRITSIAYEGGATVNIRGRDDINMDKFIRDIERRVNQINNFPQSAFRPQITQWEDRDWYFGMAIYGEASPRELKRIADEVRDDIAEMSGGQLAIVNGTLGEQVSIEVTEETLRQYNLTFSQVAQAIRETALNASGGRVRTDTGNVSIQAREQADTAAQFERIVVTQTPEGAVIRLRDIADVVDGFVDEELRAQHNGQPAAFVMVVAPDNMQIVDYTDGFKDYIERANDPASGILPEALKINILWDNSDAFKARMETIGQSALLGGVLVLIVLVLFLRPIVAFWVTIGIFTAFAGGVFLLPLFGVSLNILSLFAVLLVIGVIVDDAIIVGENIHKEVESGRRQGLDASIIGTQMVLKPVIFGVLTTIIAFLPWAFLTGPVRSFTEQITFVVVAALTFSLIESMLILPAHLAHLKPQRFDGPGGSILKVQRSIADSLLWFADHIYRPILELAVKFRYATMAFFIVLFLWATQLVGNNYVPFNFMPKIEADMIQVSVELPDGTPFTRTEQVQQQVQNGIDLMDVESRETYPEINGLIRDSSVVASGRRVQAWIGLTPPEVRPETLSSTEISNRFRELVGPIQDAEEIEVTATFNQDESGIRFSLNNEDLDLLRAAAEDVKGQLATYSTTYDIGDNLSSAADEIRVTLKPGAESLGVTLADVTSQIRQAYFGELVYRLPREGDDVEVRVRLPEDTRRNLDSLGNLRIRTSDGRQIPVNQVADFEFAPGINVIIRRDRTRSVTVRAELTDDVRGQIIADMEANYWPGFAERFPTVSRQSSGGYEAEQEFFAELMRFFFIALGAMYILLAIAFRSYSQPALLLTAVPFAYAGAVFGHLISGVPLAMFSFFGIAAAGGVVINDNLVLVDFINRRRDEGVGALQAVVDGGVSRFRPILLTSVTTFVGVLPLIAERSVGAQFLKPMVVSLGSAVTFALFVSLLLVPALYAIGVEVGRIFNWSWNGRPFRQIGETYSGHATIDEEELIGTSAHGDLKPAE